MKTFPLLPAYGFALSVATTAAAATLEVGPGKTYAAPCAAIAAAEAGDTIEIDAAGTYEGDVCSWATNDLTLRGVGGRPKIDAAGANAGGKGIWVIAGANTTIDNVELTGATVPDQNGAGIRQEGANLTVTNSHFHHNENGILAGDSAESEIVIENSEFAENGFGDGFSHNLYINHVKKLVFQYNYSHAAVEGHLLKSRALENHVLYNRLSQEGGTGSYEIDLPSGGKSYVIGNLIQQGPTTHNPTLLTYAEEQNALNSALLLFVVNNTFVNERGSGTFINVGTDVTTPVIVKNNIFAGAGTLVSQMTAALEGNFSDADGDPAFVDQAGFDYRLREQSPCKDAGVEPGVGDGVALTPSQQYAHPASSEPRIAVGAMDIGAYEVGGGTGGSGGASGTGAAGGSGGAAGDGASGGQAGSSGDGASGGNGGSDAGSSGDAGDSGDGGSAAVSGMGGSTGGSAGAGAASGQGGASPTTPPQGTESNCGCRTASASDRYFSGVLGIFAALLFVRRRRPS